MLDRAVPGDSYWLSYMEIYRKSPSYTEMLFNLRHWTFKQFFPHADDPIKYR